MRKISIKEIYNIEPDFIKKTKEETAVDWLIRARSYLLENKIANFGDIMPSKKDISEFLQISMGTVQNAIKYLEEDGYFASKQCIGTILKNPLEKREGFKMFSKKDKAALLIQKFLLKHEYKKGETIPSISELSYEIKTSTNTIRLAVFELVKKGVLRKEIYDRKHVLILNSDIENKENLAFEIKNKNLVKILKENIKKYLIQNYKTGDKIPTNLEFAKMFKVSIRTINSAIKELNREKILFSRRGRYGTVFLNKKSKKNDGEKSMFMSKEDKNKELKASYDYKWEYALENIKKYILKNHETGDKIPSMKDLANVLQTSTSTIKRAVYEMSAMGILFVQKGKYGGIFISEMPQKEENYQWVAINPKYFED